MPSWRTGYPVAAGPITAEGATLPALRASGFEVRLNAYVVGRTRRVVPIQRHGQSEVAGTTTSSPSSPSSLAVGRDRSPGCQGGATDLWYLSLVGARGQGTSLRAVWANLVSNHTRTVWLDGVGAVALGHSRLDLAGLGYPIHWTYRQALIPPSRDVQGVLESDLLTCHDPLLVPHAVRGRSRRASDGDRRGGRGAEDSVARVPGRVATPADGKADGGAVMLTSAASSADGADETATREARPLFLLLVPDALPRLPTPSARELAGEQVRDEWLARLHLRYLAARIAWLPYYPAWAAYLWRRARERGEAESLHVWCYPEPTHQAPNGTGETALRPDPYLVEGDTHSGSGPYLTAAYLCRPDPLALTTDLSGAIASGILHTPPSPACFADPRAA